MFENSVAYFRSQGYIADGDIVFACFEKPSSGWAAAFGAIGAAAAQAKAARYIVAANDRQFRFFLVDKKTGAYLNTGFDIKKEEIKKVKFGGFLGSFTLIIKTPAKRHVLSTAKKLHRYDQKDEIAKLKNLLKKK